MAVITRTSQAEWYGDSRSGNGQITSESSALHNVAYAWNTRFEENPGTNPEELIAAAHAACYSMAFASTLAKNGFKPELIETRAICSLESKPEGGWNITSMQLMVLAKIPEISAEKFDELAALAERSCPVSNLLRCGLKIELEANLA